MGKKKGSYEIALQALNSPNLRSTTAVGSTLRVGEQPRVKTETILQQVKKYVKKTVEAVKQNRKENVALWDTILDPTATKAARQVAFREWSERFTDQALPTAISGISNVALKNASLTGMTEVPQDPTQGLAAPSAIVHKAAQLTHDAGGAGGPAIKIPRVSEMPYRMYQSAKKGSVDSIVDDIIGGLQMRNQHLVLSANAYKGLKYGDRFRQGGGTGIQNNGPGFYSMSGDGAPNGLSVYSARFSSHGEPSSLGANLIVANDRFGIGNTGARAISHANDPHNRFFNKLENIKGIVDTENAASYYAGGVDQAEFITSPRNTFPISHALVKPDNGVSEVPYYKVARKVATKLVKELMDGGHLQDYAANIDTGGVAAILGKSGIKRALHREIVEELLRRNIVLRGEEAARASTKTSSRANDILGQMVKKPFWRYNK